MPADLTTHTLSDKSPTATGTATALPGSSYARQDTIITPSTAAVPLANHDSSSMQPCVRSTHTRCSGSPLSKAMVQPDILNASQCLHLGRRRPEPAFRDEWQDQLECGVCTTRAIRPMKAPDDVSNRRRPGHRRCRFQSPGCACLDGQSHKRFEQVEDDRAGQSVVRCQT